MPDRVLNPATRCVHNGIKAENHPFTGWQRRHKVQSSTLCSSYLYSCWRNSGSCFDGQARTPQRVHINTISDWIIHELKKECDRSEEIEMNGVDVPETCRALSQLAAQSTQPLSWSTRLRAA